MPSVETYLANYEDPVHAKAVVDLLDGYARDPYGNSGPLPDDVYASLCPTLAKTPGAFSVVATVDGVAAGLINCFQGFSTFKCKPLINVHDVFVHPEHRRAGLVQAMMAMWRRWQKRGERASSRWRCCPTTRRRKGRTRSSGSKTTSWTRRRGTRSSGRRTF